MSQNAFIGGALLLSSEGWGLQPHLPLLLFINGLYAWFLEIAQF